MAVDRTIINFDVRPVEGGDGKLTALKVQRTERVKRVSDTGKTLNYGVTKDVGEAFEVPIGHVADLIRELADWPIWYATGKED
jgi:hypothetical protein